MARHGVSCFDCRAAFDGPIKRNHYDAIDACEDAAGAAGWVIGHLNGQAQYACANHANQLHDALPLRAIGRGRARRMTKSMKR